MDVESLVAVAQDLEHLNDEWGPETSDPDIRRGSSVLRRLLVEDVYGAAWRAVGFSKQPKLIAVDLWNCVGGVDSASILCALAWGAHFRGLFMSSPCATIGIEPRQASPPLRAHGYPGEREFTISEFLSALPVGKSLRAEISLNTLPISKVGFILVRNGKKQKENWFLV